MLQPNVMTRRANVNKSRRVLLQLSLIAATSLISGASVQALDPNRSVRFTVEERRIIYDYYHKGAKPKTKGLPPGLAKRGGNLPPGLQKKLDRDGQLPPGLQKRLEPLPTDLSRRLPRLPEYWERVIIDRDIVLIDRRSNRVLDIIEDIIDLASGR
jgi:hypothetical protein